MDGDGWVDFQHDLREAVRPIDAADCHSIRGTGAVRPVRFNGSIHGRQILGWHRSTVVECSDLISEGVREARMDGRNRLRDKELR
jgi:hypothetical protein